MSVSNYRTRLFLPKRGFLTGLGSILNIKGSYFSFEYGEDGEDIDAKAIENDWGVIGNDMYRVMAQNPAKKSKEPK